MEKYLQRPNVPGRPRVAIALFLVVAGAFAVAAGLCSWRLLSILIGPLPSAPSFFHDLVEARTRLAGAAFLLIGAAVAAASVRRLHGFLGRQSVQNAMLVVAFGVAPLVLLEIALTPFSRPAHQKTTIFVRDSDLGWRLRPGADDMWLGQPVRINSKGLRGPEISYERTPGSIRILFLGDSVTFGDRLGNYDDTLPARIGGALAERSGRPVEAINAGISGYSPWQEARLLRSEGFRYAPDLIVVTFVLNDVTEKFELVRFGGTGQGWQLSHTYTSRMEKWLAKSSIASAVQMLAARLRFGSDTKAGAQAIEQLTVRSLVDAPQREDVKRAWDITFAELDEIIELCRERRVPLVFLVSPFTFQLQLPLEYEGRDAPQRQMARYAEERHVMLLDLLGPLTDHMRREKRDPQFYFLDSNHYSANGTSVVANVVSPMLMDSGFPAQLPLPGSHTGRR